MTILSRILRSSRQPTLRCLLLVSTLAVVPHAPARAQDPSHHYLTITTRHFRVTFTAPLEPLARRVAANAERAYAQLSAELHPPRGTIDVLISDDVDFSNGSATPTPSNRIIIYATPPVNEYGLRFTTDWAQLVVTHELTHIFHLDRSRGVWRLAQYVFGRSPFLFPNSYSPSWLVEGLAVYEESHLAGEGRIEAPEHTMLIRTAAAAGEFPSIGDASLALPTFPLGNAAYAYGSLFMDYLARTRGDSAVRKFVESSSAQIVPYLIDIPSRRAFGTTFTRAWSEWRKSVEAVTPLQRAPIDGWRPLTGDGLVVSSPRWRGDSAITFTGTNGKEPFGAFQVSLDGRESRLSRRNSVSPTVDLPDGSQLFSQLELTGPYTERSDLFVQRGGRQQRLTTNARLFTPDARADGSIVAMQIVQGASRLVRVSGDGRAIAPITAASLDTLWSEPRWSDRGDRIVAVRWFRGGVSQVVVIDTLGAVDRVVTSGRFTAAAPSWIPGDSGVAYTVGDGARNDIYLQYFRDPVVTYRLVRSDFGGFEPQLERRRSSGGSLTAAVALRADGYRLELADVASTARIRQPVAAALDVAPDPRLPALAIDSSRATEFRALRTLIPRFWVPLFEAGMDQGTYRVGGYTQGWDILHRHNVYGELRLPTDDSGIDALAEYEYRGFGLPIVTVDASQDWTSFANIVTTRFAARPLGHDPAPHQGRRSSRDSRPAPRAQFVIVVGRRRPGAARISERPRHAAAGSRHRRRFRCRRLSAGDAVVDLRDLSVSAVFDLTRRRILRRRHGARTTQEWIQRARRIVAQPRRLVGRLQIPRSPRVRASRARGARLGRLGRHQGRRLLRSRRHRRRDVRDHSRLHDRRRSPDLPGARLSVGLADRHSRGERQRRVSRAAVAVTSVARAAPGIFQPDGGDPVR